MQAIYLYINAALYLLFAVWCTVASDSTSTNLGYRVLSAGGRSEYLVIYGGLQLGLAVMFWLLARDSQYQRLGILISAAIYVPIVLYRDHHGGQELAGACADPRDGNSGSYFDGSGARIAADAQLTAKPHAMRAMLFDLDGTLVDTVYTHVIAWQQALDEAGLSIVAAKIHYRIGMSGDLLVKETCAELGRNVSRGKFDSLDRRHAILFKKMLPNPRPLPGAIELLKKLKSLSVRRGIATSGASKAIESSLRSLKLDDDMIVVDGDATANAKPDPDIFLECQKRLGADPNECFAASGIRLECLITVVGTWAVGNQLGAESRPGGSRGRDWAWLGASCCAHEWPCATASCSPMPPDPSSTFLASANIPSGCSSSFTWCFHFRQ